MKVINKRNGEIVEVELYKYDSTSGLENYKVIDGNDILNKNEIELLPTTEEGKIIDWEQRFWDAVVALTAGYVRTETHRDIALERAFSTARELIEKYREYERKNETRKA